MPCYGAVSTAYFYLLLFFCISVVLSSTTAVNLQQAALDAREFQVVVVNPTEEPEMLVATVLINEEGEENITSRLQTKTLAWTSYPTSTSATTHRRKHSRKTKIPGWESGKTKIWPTYGKSTFPQHHTTAAFSKHRRFTTTEPTETTVHETTEFVYDYNEVEGEIHTFGRCNITVFQPNQKHIVQIALWFTAGWVPFWVLLTLIVNVVYRQFGAHRFLEIWQEVGFAAIYLVMGILVLMPENLILCEVTSYVLQFLLVFVMGCAFMLAFFASSLIKGTSLKNGRLPLGVNFLWPVLLASVSVGVRYLTLGDLSSSLSSRNSYLGVQCFATIFSPLFWIFSIQAWTLWFSVLLRNQLAITACRQTRPNVDREQIYWARKTVKATPILTSWFLMTFFALLFAVDMQLFWLAMLYVGVTLVFGPLLFILHTFNHPGSNNGLYARIRLPCYRVCGLTIRPGRTTGDHQLSPTAQHHSAVAHNSSAPTALAAAALNLPLTGEIHPASAHHHLHNHNSTEEHHSIAPPPPPPPPDPPLFSVAPAPTVLVERGEQPVAARPPPAPVLPTPITFPPQPRGPPLLSLSEPTSAQVFYDWLTDGDERNIDESERILFKPKRA